MSEHYKYTTRKTKDLIPYENNSNKHSDEQVEQIANSIEKFKFTNPILIDENNGIIAGHGRVLGANKLNIEELPCIILEGLTEAEKKAYVIADNQIANNSEWDIETLKLEIESLEEMDFNIDIFGFDDDFFSELSSEDYSDKNIELNLDEFTDTIEMKFILSKEKYDFVSSKLAIINSSKEIALMTILEFDS